jgi:Lecithin retinol acyltransferase
VEPDSRSQGSGLEQEPPLGAHLITSRRGYNHHGLYVGRGQVIQYSGLSGFWQCGPVEKVSLRQFINGHPVRIVAHPESHFSPGEIVRRARSRLGENAYRLLTNNCEHFCNWCISGISRSAQVEPAISDTRCPVSPLTDPADSALRSTSRTRIPIVSVEAASNGNVKVDSDDESRD